MLDINFIRENSEKVKKACENKGIFVDVDRVIELDKKKRELMTEMEVLRAEQNKISRGGSENKEIFVQAKEIKQKIKEMEPEMEKIEAEFALSTHATRHAGEFTCWSCHEPHTYKISARSDSVINKIIAYDNNICLSCHNNINKFELISDKEKPNIIAKHDWLPNQARHFQNVRCIECHAHKKDSLLIGHNIQPKEKAVKMCQECHSKNSILMNSLYQYQLKSKATGLGFDNSVILNSSYVIGANRNIYLNRISIAIFLLVLAGISIHTILRIFLKK